MGSDHRLLVSTIAHWPVEIVCGSVLNPILSALLCLDWVDSWSNRLNGDWPRNTLISELQKRCSSTTTNLQKLTDEELVGAACLQNLAFRMIDSKMINGIDKDTFLKLPLDRQRALCEHLILTKDRIGHETVLSSFELALAGNKLMHDSSYNMWKSILEQAVVSDRIVFNLVDSNGNSMDCLKITKLGGNVTGIYHTTINGSLQLWVAERKDNVWVPVVCLGKNNHQGDIQQMGEGVVVVNEVSMLSKGKWHNSIRARFFSSFHTLRRGIPARDVILGNILSKYAEGTPDIRSVFGTVPSQSIVVIGYHFYKDAKIDLQAMGLLENFSTWYCAENSWANRCVKLLGFDGKVGGRHSLRCGDTRTVLVEAQKTLNSWASWRILCGDGMIFEELGLKTLRGSISFANPSVYLDAIDQVHFSCFMPSEGNAATENGQMSVFTYINK